MWRSLHFHLHFHKKNSEFTMISEHFKIPFQLLLQINENEKPEKRENFLIKVNENVITFECRITAHIFVENCWLNNYVSQCFWTFLFLYFNIILSHTIISIEQNLLFECTICSGFGKYFWTILLKLIVGTEHFWHHRNVPKRRRDKTSWEPHTDERKNAVRFCTSKKWKILSYDQISTEHLLTIVKSQKFSIFRLFPLHSLSSLCIAELLSHFVFN